MLHLKIPFVNHMSYRQRDGLKYHCDEGGGWGEASLGASDPSDEAARYCPPQESQEVPERSVDEEFSSVRLWCVYESSLSLFVSVGIFVFHLGIAAGHKDNTW